jgi:hypothetical protein
MVNLRRDENGGVENSLVFKGNRKGLFSLLTTANKNGTEQNYVSDSW